MSTLEPRALPADAYKGWLKNGARILQRSWDVWVPAVFVVSCLANALALSHQVVILILAAISGVVHGLNAATAERYARRERFGWAGLIACWAAEVQTFGAVLRRSLIVRTVCTLALVMAIGVMQIMAAHADPGSASLTSDTVGSPPVVSNPFWVTFFLPWNNVWFFALVFQSGGPLSMHYWLMTRCGTDGATANALLLRAVRKNPGSFFRLTAVAFALLLVSSWLPMLTVPFECFWVAVMFCAWNEVFMGKGDLEKQTVVQTHNAWTTRVA